MNRTLELLRLVQTCGQIDGRKKLQKIVHVLKEVGYPFDFRYGFHFHGPFSAELKAEIDGLKCEDLVEEQDSSDPSSEFRHYSYSVSDAGAALLKNVYENQSPDWATLAQKLNSFAAKELEAISTIVFLMQMGKTNGDIDEQFKTLKPQLVREFEVAKNVAAQLPLVSRSSLSV